VPELEYHPMPGDRSLPFSEAVRAGNPLFVSGQVGNEPGALTLVSGAWRPERGPGWLGATRIVTGHSS